jgi:hypothetical protein
MRPQLLMAAFGIFVLGTLICCLVSGRWLANGELDIINALASFQVVDISNWTGVRGFGDYWNAMVTAFSWDYPIISAPFFIFLKMFLWIVTVGVIWGILEAMLMLAQGAISAIRSLIGVFGG